MPLLPFAYINSGLTPCAVLLFCVEAHSALEWREKPKHFLSSGINEFEAHLVIFTSKEFFLKYLAQRSPDSSRFLWCLVWTCGIENMPCWYCSLITFFRVFTVVCFILMSLSWQQPGMAFAPVIHCKMLLMSQLSPSQESSHSLALKLYPCTFLTFMKKTNALYFDMPERYSVSNLWNVMCVLENQGYMCYFCYKGPHNNSHPQSSSRLQRESCTCQQKRRRLHKMSSFISVHSFTYIISFITARQVYLIDLIQLKLN